MKDVSPQTIEDAKKSAVALLGELSPEEQTLLGDWLNEFAEKIPKADAEEMTPPSSYPEVRAAFVRWLLLSDGQIEPARQSLLVLRGVAVVGTLILNEAKIRVPVRFQHCRMPGGIDAYGLRVPRLTIWGGQYGPINAIRSKVDGEFALTRDVTLDGKLDLRGASLDALIIRNATWSVTVPPDLDDDPDKSIKALDARNLETRFLQIDACAITGRVELSGAKISGEIRLSVLTLDPSDPEVAEKRTVLHLDGCRIDGRLNITPDIVARGDVSIQAATIGLGLDATGVDVGGNLLLTGTRITGALGLFDAKLKGVLDLERASAAVVDDSEDSWPEREIRLAGFAYDTLSSRAPADATSRKGWLKLRPKTFKPQPYDQLAAALRRMGRESDARDIIVERQRAMRGNDQTMSSFARALNLFLDVTVRYGYSGFRPTAFLLALFVLGGMVYRSAEMDHVIVHRAPGRGVAGTETKPVFSPWVYSFETLIPKPDLFVAHDWTLAEDRTTWPYWLYRWLHTIAGSIALILLALTPTRVLGRD